jgi:hypothetical protein
MHSLSGHKHKALSNISFRITQVERWFGNMRSKIKNHVSEHRKWINEYLRAPRRSWGKYGGAFTTQTILHKMRVHPAQEPTRTSPRLGHHLPQRTKQHKWYFKMTIQNNTSSRKAELINMPQIRWHSIKNSHWRRRWPASVKRSSSNCQKDPLDHQTNECRLVVTRRAAVDEIRFRHSAPNLISPNHHRLVYTLKPKSVKQTTSIAH